MKITSFSSSPVGRLVPISGHDRRHNRAFEHHAFVANPLGQEPELDGATWKMVANAGRALARLDQASRQIPNPGILRRPTLRREAQSTSALEGTYAPIEEVLAAEAAAQPSGSAELREVMNYVEAADPAFRWVHQYRQVSVALFAETQKTLVRGTSADTHDAGSVRTTQVVIGSPSGRVEDARFIPMPPDYGIEPALRDLSDWINDGKSREPVISAATAHYQFETIHPFNDGNGRIGRLLIVLQLMVDGVIDEPLLTVSPWFEARRSEYQDHLAHVSATGDWVPWIRFFSTGLEASATDTAQRIDRMLKIRGEHIEQLKGANVRGAIVRDIVDLLIEVPIVTAPGIARRLGKSLQGVNQAFEKLVALGVLDGPIGTYNRRFIARDILEAITAPLEA
ncbi:Fic family protein [Promicromonospora sp. NPDC090134]|uniref:Fic family protein n=1 Tax=Promicromonospora sp. NPDC090134 TaxID=3364408 RepID=UPI00381F17A8